MLYYLFYLGLVALVCLAIAVYSAVQGARAKREALKLEIAYLQQEITLGKAWLAIEQNTLAALTTLVTRCHCHDQQVHEALALRAQALTLATARRRVEASRETSV